MSQTTWEINGRQYTLDIGDVETLERYEAAFERMRINAAAMPKDGKLSAIAKQYCAMYVTLYDDLFGAGAGQDILGDKLNMDVCDDTYESFLDFIGAQRDAATARRQKLAAYAPRNRQQRRHK